MELRNQGLSATRGYAMAALLVMLGVMAVLLTVAMPTWRQLVQREKEEELVFRGRQYVRAVGLFQRKYAASFPPNIDTLLSQRFLRRKYADPMTEDGEFQVLYQMSAQQPGQTGGRGGPGSQGRGGPASSGRPGTTASGQQGSSAFGGGTLGPRGGMIGVASKSSATSIRLYNGRNHYNEWQFIYAPTLMPGQGMGRPGMPGGRGGTGPGGMGPGRGGRGTGPGGGPGSGQPMPFPQGGRGGRGPGG
jgi:type II secretory pathway pseudopilin PulG